MTPSQLRMARAALQMGVRDLAAMSEIATGTVTRYETEKGGMQADTRDKIQNVLEGLGIAFEPDNGNGSGVRFKAGE